jgi:acid stress-induced BolA-like protein IbaG/YrbA|tara:strand:+ start:516 stop:737 length:222 start_codon:yes stop_codon:yes gene_type:complete
MQDELTAKITRDIPGADVDVQLDGNRAMIIVTSDAFVGMSRVKQQQTVYASIDAYISDGRLHAVTIKAQIPNG